MTGAVLGPAIGVGEGHRSTTALLFLLCLFMFFLPLAEAPKNLVAALYLLVWVGRSAWLRDWGGPWDWFDSAFAVMLASAVLSGVIGGYSGDLTDGMRVFAVAWVSKRIAFSQSQRKLVWIAGGVGLVVSLAAASLLMMQGRKIFLELPSVGHVNQSALYIAIFACATLGWTLQSMRSGKASLAATAGAAFVFGMALLVSGSRAAILAYVVFAAAKLLLLAWHGEHHGKARRHVFYASLWLILAGLLVVGLGKIYPQLSGKKLQATQWASVDSVDIRVRHWQLAVDGWRHKPWLGFGPASFQRLDPQQVCAWRAERGETCDPSRYVTASHAHSLYVSTLVERGIVGLAALGFLLGLWGWALFSRAREAASSPLWVASAAGFAVVAVGGLFNTTLRVEHGSLALLVLALWLAARREPT